MNKLYNNQEEIASNIENIIKNIFPDIRKTVLNILPFILTGIILSESVVASDIAKHLKGNFSFVQFDSVIKRIRRFFKNRLFDPYLFYDKIIRFVIKNYKKKHSDNRVHIIFDHMFSRDNYVVFMITMRIGKQGIPLWFRCFKDNNISDAFSENLLKEGISYVSNLFDDNYDLIFLADRWFNSTSLMQHIESLNHTFVIRLKGNIKVLTFDKKEGHYVWKWVNELFAYERHSNFLYDAFLTENKFKINIAISKKKDVKEHWFVVTNGDPKRAIKDYGYRFGGIETVFKNQKTNGFNLEKTINADIKYFTTQYMLACFGILILTIMGADFSKNSKCYKNVKITTQKYSKSGKKIRTMSLFNTGLTLFHLAYNSPKYIRLPFRLILYDV